MRPFIYQAVSSPSEAVAAFATLGDARNPAAGAVRRSDAIQSPVQYLAGGTTLIDLMKLDVMRPERIVDINALQGSLGSIEAGPDGLRLGAMVRMAEAAEHPIVRRDYPVIAQSLQLAASQQLRNMAARGGNVLQRTRGPRVRDTSYAECNKRNPGSGCAAVAGYNRSHAVLGASDQCIATYPGDFAQALIALDAGVDVAGPDGRRSVPFAALHREPGTSPEVETQLAPGEMITSFFVPAAPWWRRSVYVKVRDRQSYEFALASAAVALDLAEDDAASDGQGRGGAIIRDLRIALGGVATVPWRARAAEDVLRGKPLDESTVRTAAEAAFAGARPSRHNAFKVALGQRTLVRALHEAAAMEIRT